MVFKTRSARERGSKVFPGQDSNLDRLRQRTRLHRVLETPGIRAVAQSCYGADVERRRLVGPGRFLWSNQDLRAARTSRHSKTKLSRRWTMEPRRLVAQRR